MSERRPLGPWTVTHTIVALFVLCVTGPGGVVGMVVGRPKAAGITTLAVAVALALFGLAFGTIGPLEVLAGSALFGVPAAIGVAVRGVLDGRALSGGNRPPQRRATRAAAHDRNAR